MDSSCKALVSRLLNHLWSELPHLRPATVSELSELGTDVIRELLDRADAAPGAKEVTFITAVTVAVVKQLGGEAGPVLLEHTGDKPGISRRIAVRALGALPEETPISPELLLALSQDNDLYVRSTGIALSARFLKGQAEAIVAQAFSDRSPLIREAACKASGALSPPQARHLLIAALNDSSSGVRAEAAMAVGRAGATGEASALVPLLEDESPEVRLSAVWALGEVGSRDHLECVGQLTRDKDREVALAARDASSKLEGRNGESANTSR